MLFFHLFRTIQKVKSSRVANNLNHKDMAKIHIISPNFPEDLAYSFKYFFYFGRFLGVIPFEGLKEARVEKFAFRRWKSVASLTSALISICLGFNMSVAAIGFYKAPGVTASERTWSAHLFFFYGTGFFIYTYFLLYSDEFIQLLQKWKAIKLNYPVHDKNLRRDVNLVTCIIFISIACENTTWHWRHFIKNIVKLNSTHNHQHASNDWEFGNLEFFYSRSEPEYSSIIPYHLISVTFIWVTSKWALFSWNYYDVLLIVISRAFYRKYQLLNDVAKKILFDYGFSKDASKWQELIADHLTLTRVLESFQTFLSPIVFVSYAANIYDVTIHISLGLSNQWSTSTIGTIYSIWAFIHLTTRLFLVSLAASRINEHALRVAKLLKKCPVMFYTLEIEKFERRLFRSKIGLHGFGSFTITKPFMLRLLGVLFTIEIVLIQSSTCGPHKKEESFD